MDGAQKKKRVKYGFKALSDVDRKTLEKVYKEEGVYAGRDRLYFFIKEKYPEFKGSQRAVLDWLKHQETWQLSQVPQKHSTVAPLAVMKSGYCQADLGILTSYKDRGYDCFLSVVDGFTKHIWSRAIRGQSEDAVVKAMEDILKGLPLGRISVIQTDRGSHFQSKFVKLLEENGIKHFYSKARTPTSNAFAERIGVGNVKKMLFAGMRQRNDKKWAEYLPQVVSNLNSLKSFSTGMTPKQLEQATPDKQGEVADKISATLNKTHKGKQITRTLQVGQKVRLKRDLGTGIRKPGK